MKLKDSRPKDEVGECGSYIYIYDISSQFLYFIFFKKILQSVGFWKNFELES